MLQTTGLISVISCTEIKYNDVIWVEWICCVVVTVEFGPWTSYQIRKIVGCACAGNAGTVFPTRRLQRKPLVSDPGIHHGTCVTHVPWCMLGSLICSGGENVPGIPGACAPAILRIWQEAHITVYQKPGRMITRTSKNCYNLSSRCLNMY